MDPRAIVDALAGDPGQLARLGTEISRNDASVQSLAGSIAASNALSQSIVQAGAPAPLLVPPVAADIPCGSLPERGQAYGVRPGFCFPDNKKCNGSILENPDQPKIPISIRNIFLRDSLFTNFSNTSARDLTEMIDPQNAAAFLIEPGGDTNVFNFRNYFFTDPTDRSLLKYNDNPATNRNLVRLKYDVGFSYERIGGNLETVITTTDGANPREIAEREVGLKLVPTMSFKKSWTLCPNFFTYRMIPLKAGFMSTYGYIRLVGTRGNMIQLSECTGVKYPDTDVYIYTFVDQFGNPVTHNTKINGETRLVDNSFAAGDLPYEDDLFRFPKKANGERLTVKIAARYPDGILLFHSDDGYFGPVPPFGTIVRVDKLYRGSEQKRGYPDQAAHTTITNALRATIVDLTTTHQANYDGTQISFNGVERDISTVPNISNLIIGACGYISMMNAIRILVRTAVGDRTIGGNSRGSLRQIRHYNNNKSIKRNKTKSKSKRRGRARAASMLKSAKQRFYRRGGGLGSSGPQPLQCNSPLVSQASPV
jgi:hypothetical protein